MPPRQRQNRSTTQASDYESDVHDVHVPPPSRTNTELNLSVLQRYNPAITSILSIVANAVIYTFHAGSWEKSGVEGAMFMCEQEAGFCVVVLNRKGLENLILDLSQIGHIEVSGELIIMNSEEKVVGVWMHADKDDTRDKNAALMMECWERVKA